MQPSIRVDDEVYSWLQAQAVPFDDTPNSVLRRLAGLSERPSEMAGKGGGPRQRKSTRRSPMTRGPKLIKRWPELAGVKQARFHHESTWYGPITSFPAALCDCEGCIVFKTERELRSCPGVRIGDSKEIHVPGGIWSLPGYQKVSDPIR